MCRSILLILFFIATALNCHAERKFSLAKVDELYELTSIVWRLAGASEYSECMLSDYANSIDDYFAPYKQHPIVAYCNKIRKARAISYDSPLSAAAFFTVKSGGIGYIDGYCADSIIGIDARWTKVYLDRYIKLLDDFYKVSKFNEFFVSQSHVYKQAEMIIDSLMTKRVDTRWFEDFFGAEFPEFMVFVSINNGPSNYSFGKKYYPKARRGIILGGLKDDYFVAGKMTHYSSLFNTIIHEITHIMEPSVLVYSKQLEEASIKAYDRRKDVFSQTGVGFEGIPVEWLTRLYVIKYLNDHFSRAETDKQILREMSVGFIWMQRSYDFLHHFDENRNMYPYIVDFIPQLLAFFNHSILVDYDVIEREWLAKIPYVEDVFPAPGTELDFSSDSIRVKFTFSCDMNMDVEGIEPLYHNPHAPVDISGGWGRSYWQDCRTYVFVYDSKVLEKLGFYGIKLIAEFMQAVDGYNMMKDYIVKYK